MPRFKYEVSFEAATQDQADLIISGLTFAVEKDHLVFRANDRDSREEEQMRRLAAMVDAEVERRITERTTR